MGSMSKDKIERRAYEQREKAIRDYYSYMNAFKEEGLQQGLEQGMQKGLYQQAIQTAKNMLKDKVDIELISKYTSLSINEIEELKAKLDM
jgi:predicted transposase/invertase (TIGR01784 family)